MKTLMTAFLALCMTAGAWAQPHDDKRAESLRIAFLTEYLSLTTEEAQAFWPVYNEMRDQAKAIMEARRDRVEQADFDNMSEDAAREFVDQHFQSEQDMLALRRQYAARYTEVLPMKKVAMLTLAEEAFKRELLKHARERREGPPRGGGRGPGPRGGDRP